MRDVKITFDNTNATPVDAYKAAIATVEDLEKKYVNDATALDYFINDGEEAANKLVAFGVGNQTAYDFDLIIVPETGEYSFTYNGEKEF